MKLISVSDIMNAPSEELTSEFRRRMLRGNERSLLEAEIILLEINRRLVLLETFCAVIKEVSTIPIPTPEMILSEIDE